VGYVIVSWSNYKYQLLFSTKRKNRYLQTPPPMTDGDADIQSIPVTRLSHLGSTASPWKSACGFLGKVVELNQHRLKNMRKSSWSISPGGGKDKKNDEKNI